MVSLRHRLHAAFCGSKDNPRDLDLGYSPDGRLLATACGSAAYLWDTRTWARTARIADGQPTQQLAFSPDGRLLATGGNRGYVSVYAVDGGARVARFPVDTVAWDLSFSGDGRYLVAASGGLTGKGRAIVWDLREGRSLHTIEHGGTVHAAAFSPDSRLVLTGSADGIAKLTEAASGALEATLRHAGNVYAVAFSADGAHAMTGSADGSVRVWRVADGEPVREILHSDPVTSIALSPDGRYLATGGHDNQVHVWRLADGRELAREQYPGPITRIAFNPGDGRYVAAVGHYYDHAGSVWMWRDEDLRAQARQRVTRSLSEAERARYLPTVTGPRPAPDSRSP